MTDFVIQMCHRTRTILLTRLKHRLGYAFGARTERTSIIFGHASYASYGKDAAEGSGPVETTRCPKVRVSFDAPLFSELGGQIMKSFGVLNQNCARFF